MPLRLALTSAKLSLTKAEKADGGRRGAGVPSGWNLPRYASLFWHRPHACRPTSMLLLCRWYTCAHLRAERQLRIFRVGLSSWNICQSPDVLLHCHSQSKWGAHARHTSTDGIPALHEEMLDQNNEVC